MNIRLEIETEDFMDEVLCDQLNARGGAQFETLKYDDMSGIACNINLKEWASLQTIGEAIIAFLTTLEQGDAQ